MKPEATHSVVHKSISITALSNSKTKALNPLDEPKHPTNSWLATSDPEVGSGVEVSVVEVVVVVAVVVVVTIVDNGPVGCTVLFKISNVRGG